MAQQLRLRCKGRPWSHDSSRYSLMTPPGYRRDTAGEEQNGAEAQSTVTTGCPDERLLRLHAFVYMSARQPDATHAQPQGIFVRQFACSHDEGQLRSFGIGHVLEAGGSMDLGPELLSTRSTDCMRDALNERAQRADPTKAASAAVQLRPSAACDPRSGASSGRPLRSVRER